MKRLHGFFSLVRKKKFCFSWIWPDLTGVTSFRTHICCAPVPLTFRDLSYSFELQILMAHTPWDPSHCFWWISEGHTDLSIMIQELTGLILEASVPLWALEHPALTLPVLLWLITLDTPLLCGDPSFVRWWNVTSLWRNSLFLGYLVARLWTPFWLSEDMWWSWHRPPCFKRDRTPRIPPSPLFPITTAFFRNRGSDSK